MNSFQANQIKNSTVEILKTWPKWPQFGSREIEAVSRVVRSNQLFAAHEVKTFESDFANFQGSNYAVGVGNATQGLHLALSAAEIGEGDEVIVTTCSWISTASCILMQNAIPVFIDIEKETLGLDPDLLEKALTPATKAIIAVHILGYPSKIDLIREFANKHNLILIEDASHAPGAKLNGKQIGTFGDLAVYSLQQRKAISTGDGGVVCTNNSIFADKIRKQRSFGDHELSYNYRMTEFAAALGRIGLEKLDDDNQNREKCALFLHEYLKDHDWIKVRLARPFEKGVYYAVALEINLNDEMCNKLLNWCLDFGLPMRKLFSPLNKHPHFFNSPVPARGLPWQHPTYKGENGKLPYSEQHFPVAYEYCHGRILELYTHPGTKDHHLEAFGVLLQELYKMIPDGNSRPNWSS